MRTKRFHEVAVLTVAVILTLSAAGCSSMGGTSGPPPNPVGQQDQAAAPTRPTQAGSTSAAPAPLTGVPRPIFYDFPDIPTPQELELQPKESYTVQYGAIKTGILTLRGRVDLNSLLSFFQMAMPRENWKPKGYFRYQRSVLIFEKPDKTCVIRMYEGLVYTYVEIFVAPANT